MEAKFESDIIKIPASQLKEMNLAEVIRYILDKPARTGNISFDSLHPIYVSGLTEQIPVQLIILIKAG